MTVDRFLSTVRTRLRDELKEEYTDSELIDYLNDAISSVSMKHIMLKNPEFINELVFTGGNEQIPDDFVKFVSEYPVYLIGRNIKSYYPLVESIELRYYQTFPFVISLTDEIKFREPYVSEVILLTTKLALGKNGYDLTQEDKDLANYSSILQGAIDERSN